MNASLCLCLAAVLLAADDRGKPGVFQPDRKRHDEAALKKDYDRLLQALDATGIATQHAGAVAALKARDAAGRIAALQTLARTGNPDALPLMLPLLDEQVTLVRLWAGASVSQLVERYALRRRDPAVRDRVVLKPLGQGDRDLRPLRWVVVRMLNKPDDGNTHAYAATLIRYLELGEFRPELRELLKSRHPAVSGQARWALQALEQGNDPTKSH
jgi:hypothetical protein